MYHVIGPRAVGPGEPGEDVELDLTPQEESGHVAAKRLRILPRTYRVIGPRVVLGAQPGEEFSAALPMYQEQTLAAGGHVEIVQELPAITKRKRADKET
jgi:hypothetical protein